MTSLPSSHDADADRSAGSARAGHAMLDQLQDQATQAGWSATLDGLAPGVADWAIAAVFGGIYQRPGLSLRDRQLLNVGALCALGGVEPQLEGHLRTCLRIGMTTESVVEAIVHLIPYVGLPKALAGLRVADAVTSADARSPEPA